jgi:hypothetical protein
VRKKFLWFSNLSAPHIIMTADADGRKSPAVFPKLQPIKLLHSYHLLANLQGTCHPAPT